MKSIFKKIMGIGLLCFTSLMQASSTEVAQIEQCLADDSTVFTIVELIGKIHKDESWRAKAQGLLFETTRKKYLRLLVESGKLEKEADLGPVFKKLSTDEGEAKYVALMLKSKLHELSDTNAVDVANFLPDKERAAWYKKNLHRLSYFSALLEVKSWPDAEKDAGLKEINLFWRACCCDDPKAKGPLFSTEFRLKKSEYIIELVLEEMRGIRWWDSSAQLLRTKDCYRHFREMMPKVTQFVKEQYQEDRIVFFHGQSDLWGYLGMVFDMLAGIKNGQPLPEDFVRLSLQEKPVFESSDQVADIRKRGIVDGERKYGWRHILCTNLHFLANYKDKNSLMFVLRNHDMTQARGVNLEWMVEQMVIELDMLPEYEKLIKEEPKLFTRLYDLYKKDIVARGDFGRLVVVSMPKEVATRLAYSSGTGGRLKSYYVGGEWTTDVVKIAEYYRDMGHENEYVVIMGEEMTNPYKAAQAGVIMASFTADANEESLPLALVYKKEFDVVRARMTAFHDERKEQVRSFRTVDAHSLAFAGMNGLVKKQGIEVALAALYPRTSPGGAQVSAVSDHTLVD